MPILHDDNFGDWSGGDDAEMRAFYYEVQAESIWKECRKCGAKVKLRPDYAICNSCCEQIETGREF